MRNAGSAGSIRELAKRLDKSHEAVRKWLGDSRFPFARKGPWDAALIAKIAQWARDTLAPDPAAAAGTTASADPAAVNVEGSYRRARAALTAEKARTEKLNREIKQGLYHRIDECEARRLRQITTVRTELLEMANAAPFDSNVKDWINQRAAEICDRFAGVG